MENRAELKNKVEQYVDDNLSVIQNWMTIGEDNIAQIKILAVDIAFHREGIIHGGSFVAAVVDNDLDKCIEYGDGLCMRSLKLFVMVKKWVHVY